ncbi:hypothetical protein AB8B02_05190 [Tardiphaga sp. 862_B3_N4_1]|uniref:hypothetical protein n=1 Tax=Tardiphaga sp. 862_B3_N4_1 TaxID=3240764 RepID=UPI003F1F4F73
MSEIKASVHCPRPDKPTWKRHFGFDYTAQGALSNAIKATGDSRHKATWTGAPIGHGRSIEWRIFIRGTSLLRTPQPASSNVHLIASPTIDETLIFTVSIGATNQLFEFPKAADAQTRLLEEGSLVDGRQFWVTYCYVPLFNPPISGNKTPRQIRSQDTTITPGDTLRILTPHPNEDGSLAFFEWRAEMTGNTVQAF